MWQKETAILHAELEQLRKGSVYVPSQPLAGTASPLDQEQHEKSPSPNGEEASLETSMIKVRVFSSIP